MLLWPFNKYPGTDYETFNWEWLLKTVKEWVATMQTFKNSITAAWEAMRGDWQEFTDHTYKEQITDILEDHPEWVTTVMDGSITEPKINSGFLKEIKNNYVTPEMFGAVGDGVADDTTAVQTACNTANIIYLKGKYRVTDTIDMSNVKTIISDGACITGSVNGDVVKVDKLEYELFSVLSANLPEGSCISPTNIDGDIAIMSTESFNPARTYYKDGEFNSVHNSYFESPTESEYPSNSLIYEVSFGTFNVIGELTIINENSGVDAIAFNAKGLARQAVENIIAKSNGSMAAMFSRCYKLTVNIVAEQYRLQMGTTDYGIAYANCQDITDTSKARGNRHGVTVGGNDEDLNIVNRNIKIWGMYNNKGNANVGSADCHGNCDKIFFSCRASQGINFGGKNISISNCTCPKGYDNRNYGFGLYGTELIPGNINIDNVSMDIGPTANAAVIQLNYSAAGQAYVNIGNLIIGGGIQSDLIGVFGTVSQVLLNMANIQIKPGTITRYLVHNYTNSECDVNYNNVVSNTYAVSAATVTQQGLNTIPNSTPVTVAEGCTIHNQYMEKSGNTKQLLIDFTLSPDAINTPFNIGTLANEFKPARTIVIKALTNAADTLASVVLNSNGTMTASYNNSGTHRTQILVTYL